MCTIIRSGNAIATDERPPRVLMTELDVRAATIPADRYLLTPQTLDETLYDFVGETVDPACTSITHEVADALWDCGVRTYEFCCGPVVYVIGPVSGHDDLNRPAFETARKTLEDAGFEVVTIPHDLVPRDAPYDECMRISLAYLLHTADLVVALPGSDESCGASLERLVARIIDVPVMSTEEACELACELMD